TDRTIFVGRVRTPHAAGAAGRAPLGRQDRELVAMPRLSIIIVTYNSRTEIDETLRALRHPRPRTDHEIVVVDNAPADGTSSHVRTAWAGVRAIDSGAHL